MLKVLGICVGLLWCAAFSLQGQAPFVQASQAVLAFHPSNAGARHAPRASFVTNHYKADGQQSFNTYFSYDQFLEKQKLGVGTFYTYSNDKVSPLPSSVQENVPKDLLSSYFITENSHTFGLSFSPKLNIQQKTNFNETAFTLSPSFYISYTQDDMTYQTLQEVERFEETLYSPEYPSGVLLKEDSVRTSFWKNHIKDRAATLGLGLQFTTTKAIVQLKLPVSWHVVSEAHAFNSYTTVTNRTVSDHRNDTRNIIDLNPELNGGYSFTLSEVDELYLTVMGATAFRIYTIDSKKEASYGQGFYGEYLQKRKKTGWHYGHLSALFRKGKGLLGGGYTYLDDLGFYAATLGVQSTHAKITASLMFGERRVLETSVSWVF